MGYKVKTKKSNRQRSSNPVKKIGTGIVMFIIGTILLFWNEGDYVKTKSSINEAQSVVVEVDDVSSPDPDLNGKLIYGVSKVQTNDILRDELLGISANAVNIWRLVEYYQLVEESTTSSNRGRSRSITYTYKKDWVGSPVNSSGFKDPQYQSANSVIIEIEDEYVAADNVSWGAYKLPSFIIDEIDEDMPIDIQISEQQKAEWEKKLQLASKASAENIHISDNEVYFGADPSSPAIGDVRVTVTYTPPGVDISLMAQVQDNTFIEFMAKNGIGFWSVENGVVSAAQMFENKIASNLMMTWILRVLGMILILIGLKMMFSILPALLNVLPILGSIVSAGVGLVCIVFGLVWSFLIIGIAWLFYRPLIAIIFLLIAGAGIWLLKKKMKGGVRN
jgi:ABC-type polysaccharide/polyol phosphate export systems, permease component